jgi:hypothetical protein
MRVVQHGAALLTYGPRHKDGEEASSNKADHGTGHALHVCLLCGNDTMLAEPTQGWAQNRPSPADCLFYVLCCS